MDKVLPQRPNLDHLRRQAKALLAALEAGEAAAISTIQQHLPTAEGLSTQQIRKLSLRLADAQSAIARKSGFASWPQLARHIEQLRGLEGTWGFEKLEVDGQPVPVSYLTNSRILMDGDCFRTESPEANYEGVFNINVEAQPHEIDIEFVEGPEAGNTNYGIFHLDGDQLTICLDMSGKSRPKTFTTTPGSQHACETLRRTSTKKPEAVTGGTRSAPPPPTVHEPCVGFEYRESPTLSRLQGEWKAVKLVMDGKDFPEGMLAAGQRVAVKNEVKIIMGGKVIIHALVRIKEGSQPLEIDYYHLDGMNKGKTQHGIIKWIGEEACFNMAPPGQPKPENFECTYGSQRTLSQWRLK
ncbi:MAG: TIGR03067 domain-containing protein [Gemmatales bacterium]